MRLHEALLIGDDADESARVFGSPRGEIQDEETPAVGRAHVDQQAFTPFYRTWSAIDPFNAGFVAGAQNIQVGDVTRSDNAFY